MTAEYEGRAVPVVWTREHEEGRICYVCPGYSAESLEHPAVEKLVNTGLAWVRRR